jgi:hypothetical protein
MFNLELDLAESYIYGHAVTDNDKLYKINIQVGNQSLIFPEDFEIDANQALISFDIGEEKKIILNSSITKSNTDMIEFYINDDKTMQNLANHLPVSMTMVING